LLLDLGIMFAFTCNLEFTWIPSLTYHKATYHNVFGNNISQTICPARRILDISDDKERTTMHHRGIESLSEFTVPAARVENLVTTTSRDEVLVYDQDRHHIHHLNATAAVVWNLCNGRRTVNELARIAAIDEDAVCLALRKLEDAHLLEGPLETGVRGTTQSRRSFMKKAAVAGVAVPMIASVSAPSASAANSANKAALGASCKGGGNCASGNCCGNVCTATIC
jgi:hypothetical protein